MLHHKRLFVLFVIVMALTMALSGCAGGKATGKEIKLRLSAEPPTLDPNLAEDDQSINCIQQLFWGLTDYDDKTLEVIPELATEWKTSADGLVWTFKLRKDVQWVQYDPATKKATKKGPVTAKDVVYGVKRTIKPETASPYAYMMAAVKNAEKVNKGEIKDLDAVGVKAVDDYTVEFTLEYPAGYFAGLAGLWCYRATPQKAIEEYGEKWTEPGKIWTNGEYMLESWEHEKVVTMLRNPHHPLQGQVDIAKIVFHIVKEDSTAFAMYENDELEVCAVPTGDMDRVKADPTLSKELYQAPQLSTYYYGFNTTKKPFDNAKVRKAFSMAIDRQKLIDTVLKGNQKPAKSFACPGIFGSVAEDASFKGVSFDPAGAKKLLEEAGFPGGKGLPEVTLMFNTSEGHQKIAQFIQQNWKEHLGVEVKLANQEWAVYLKTVHGADTPQIYRMGWGADYPDQNNWVAENFNPAPGKSSNDPKWNKDAPAAKRFTELVEKAAGSTNKDERKKMYFEAEKILVEDEAIIAPIYYYVRNLCTKPHIQRAYAPMGGEHIAKWKITSK